MTPTEFDHQETRSYRKRLLGFALSLAALGLFVFVAVSFKARHATAQNAQGSSIYYLVGSASTPATANGAGTPIMWPGGNGVFDCAGTLNGATVTVKVLLSDGATYLSAGSGTVWNSSTTSPALFVWGRGMIEGVISGAGGSTSLQCAVRPVTVLIG